ncbi:MAG: Tox-REase-5 domain-containing protein [Stellaceae bacterium]
MGLSVEAGKPSSKARAKTPRLILDPDDVVLDDGDILVKHAADGGYFCLGLGVGAAFLHAVDEDEGRDGLEEREHHIDDAMLAKTVDPSLRRLFAAIAFAKAGYNEGEDRDERGRWTSSGAAAATAGAAAAELFSAPALVPALRQFAAGLLPSGAAGVGAAVAALGVLVIPTNRSLISEGSVPDAPGLSYHFDQGTGVLQITRDSADGTKETLYSGQHAGGVFRDSNGNIVGRDLGSSVVIDPDAIPGYSSRAAAGSSPQSRAQVRSDAAVDRDEPKLCPDPGSDTPGWMKRSERALAYQEQISGLQRGLAIDFNSVSFDGCRERDGTLLEAKGLGFEWAMTPTGEWRVRYEGTEDIMKQAKRQSEAAPNRRIEWHFAEKRVADHFRDAFAGAKLTNITVFYTPAIRRNIF